MQGTVDKCETYVVNLWSTNSLIPYYTDHGRNHSLRIIERIEQLPKFIERSVLLNDDEVFLLLLAALLHDIGMQCDLIKHPEVKKRAEEVDGALFSDAPTTRELRRYHHIVTAAWLHVAFFNKISTLHDVINQNNLLTQDHVVHLEKICSYHSKKNIESCPKVSVQGDKIKLQFLAALLRLGDELDIAKERAKIELMDMFNYPDESALYWYIHSQTKVEISEKEIFVKLTLSFKDFKTYGCKFIDYIQQIYTKNESVLKILNLHGVSFEFGSANDCVNCEDIKDMPDNIILKLFPFPPDYSEAIQPLVMSAEEGNAEAQHTLGSYCSAGFFGIKQDPNQAAIWYAKAAEQDYVEAQYDLGYCYYNGFGVGHDFVQAVNWWKKAAEKGYVQALHGLGTCYLYGKGVKQDSEQAKILFAKATKRKTVVVQDYSGEC